MEQRRVFGRSLTNYPPSVNEKQEFVKMIYKTLVKPSAIVLLTIFYLHAVVVLAKLRGPATKQLQEEKQTQRQLIALQDFGSSPSDRYPLGPCQGDCDHDYQCQKGLKCFFRSHGEPVPGCTGLDSARPQTDFCIYPNGIAPSSDGSSSQSGPASTSFTAMPVAHFETPAPAPVAAVSRADTPSPFSVPVPVPVNTTVNTPINVPATGPTPAPTVDFASLGTFKLKMYWEAAFYWQCSRQEVWWCMHCRNDACNLGDEIYVTNCSSTAQQFEFVPVTADNKHVLIKLADKNYCFQKYRNHNFNLQVCDPTNVYQHWFAGAGGFDEAKFQINPVWNTTYCATQRHQPKNDEQVHLEPVNVTLISHTNFWVRYH